MNILSSLTGKRIMVTGTSGQVGGSLLALLNTRLPSAEVFSAGRSGSDIVMDLSEPDRMVSVLNEVRPDIIINPAAYTNVDQAESEAELAYQINAEAPAVIAEWCKKHNSLLVHFSTDYVYDQSEGSAEQPLKEDAALGPVNIYGKSKLAGERNIEQVGGRHLIFRTSWVYSLLGKNFLKSITNAARQRTELRVVADQFGTPTPAEFLAREILSVLGNPHSVQTTESGTERIFNLTTAGYCSWYQYATLIVKVLQTQEPIACEKVTPVTSSEYKTAASRPCWSVMDCSKYQSVFQVESLPSWESEVNQMVKRLRAVRG